MFRQGIKKDHLKKGPIKKNSLKKVPPPKKTETKKRNFNLAGLAVIILLGIIVYSNSFNCTFQFDDFSNIVDNLKIRNLSDVKAIWDSSPNRPVAVFTFALNYHFNQLDVRYWHFFNLVVHLINSCLVWWLTLLIFSSPAMKDHKIAEHKKLLAFLTALLFVSHPLATQSVTYIVQRMTSLVAMFYLLSVSLYLKARLTDKGNTSKILLFAGSFISAMLAMLTKENAFTLPFAIILVEFFFVRTRKPSVNLKDYRVILLMAAFLGVILIIPLKYSFSVFDAIPPSKGHTYTLTPFNYLLTQFSVIVKYIQLLFIPANQMVDYDFPVSENFFEIRTLLSFLVLSLLIFLAVFLYKRNRIISFGISWFFLTLLIESSIIPINDVIFEHRTYLPSFGFFLIISSGVYALFPEKYKYLAVAVLAIVIVTNSYLTYQRNKIWKDSITLWTDNTAKAPGCARSVFNRGHAHEVLQEWEKAITDYSRAIQIDPKYGEAYYNRGHTYGAIRQWEKAIADYSKTIEINPNFSNAYLNRGNAYEAIQQWDKAIADYTRTIRISPDYAAAYYNRGHSYGAIKDWGKAIADYSKAIGINPDYAAAYYNRAYSYGAMQDWEKAIADYTRAIGIDPNNASAYYNRGIAYGKLKEWDKAITDYSSAIRIDPNHKEAFVNRGNAYGNLGQWDKAMDNFNDALRIDPYFTVAKTCREIASGNLKNRKGR